MSQRHTHGIKFISRVKECLGVSVNVKGPYQVGWLKNFDGNELQCGF